MMNITEHDLGLQAIMNNAYKLHIELFLALRAVPSSRLLRRLSENIQYIEH